MSAERSTGDSASLRSPIHRLRLFAVLEGTN
jgi:hypothetical protein